MSVGRSSVRQFRPAGPPLQTPALQVSDDALLVAAGLKPAADEGVPETPKKKRKETATRNRSATDLKMQSKSVLFPKYIWDQLKRRALDEDCSVRFLILKGLRAIETAIDEADMIEDRRRERD